MKKMIENISVNATRAAEETIFLFNYEGVWMTDKQLVKATQSIWTNVKTNRTKYTILSKPMRWGEVPFDAEGDVAAELFDGKHYITTNGKIITGGREMYTRKLTVSIMNKGVDTLYNISDLLYHAFLNREYDAESGMTVISDFYEAIESNKLTLKDIDVKNQVNGVAIDSSKFKKKVIETKEVEETTFEQIELYLYDNYVFNLNGLLFNVKNEWNVSDEEKTAILNTPERRREVPKFIKIVKAVKVFREYYITDNGYVLDTDFNNLLLRNNSMLYMNINGRERWVCVQDVMYYAFVDHTVDPTESLVWVKGMNINNVEAGSITVSKLIYKRGNKTDQVAAKGVSEEEYNRVVELLKKANAETERLKKKNATLKANLAKKESPRRETWVEDLGINLNESEVSSVNNSIDEDLSLSDDIIESYKKQDVTFVRRQSRQ